MFYPDPFSFFSLLSPFFITGDSPASAQLCSCRVFASHNRTSSPARVIIVRSYVSIASARVTVEPSIIEISIARTSSAASVTAWLRA